MNLFKVIKQQGGVKLIKSYLKNGLIHIAVINLILLGKEKKALEISRLAMEYKMQYKLKRRYKQQLFKLDDEIYGEQGQSCNIIWVCWLQGIENAPYLVKKCYTSLITNLHDKQVVLITKKNIYNYVQFPPFIITKWEAGIITDTHISDMLRLELLTRYGGTWIDATVFCSEISEKIPKYFFDSDLFFFQSLKPGRDGHSHINSSWFITAKSNNKFLKMCLKMCYEYWKENNCLTNYFLLHDFMAIILENNQSIMLNMIPRDNATPHILYLRLFEKYDENVWNILKEQVPFHKLSYKFDVEKTKITGTYYDRLFN